MTSSRQVHADDLITTGARWWPHHCGAVVGWWRRWTETLNVSSVPPSPFKALHSNASFLDQMLFYVFLIMILNTYFILLLFFNFLIFYNFNCGKIHWIVLIVTQNGNLRKDWWETASEGSNARKISKIIAQMNTIGNRCFFNITCWMLSSGKCSVPFLQPGFLAELVCDLSLVWTVFC